MELSPGLLNIGGTQLHIGAARCYCRETSANAKSLYFSTLLTLVINHEGLTFVHSDTLRCEFVVLFFLAAEFHRFLTAFSDLPGSNFAILVQLRNMGGECTQPRLRRMSSARDTIGHGQSAITNAKPARASFAKNKQGPSHTRGTT